MIVTIVNVGVNRVIRKNHRKKHIECRNIEIYLCGVRWFSKNARKMILDRLARDWPGWALSSYALNREIK